MLSVATSEKWTGFSIWVSKLRTELVLSPSRWYELFLILNVLFLNSLGSLGAHFSRVPAPTWVYFPTPVNVELLPLKNGRVFWIWVSKLRTELVLSPL